MFAPPWCRQCFPPCMHVSWRKPCVCVCVCAAPAAGMCARHAPIPHVSSRRAVIVLLCGLSSQAGLLRVLLGGVCTTQHHRSVFGCGGPGCSARVRRARIVSRPCCPAGCHGAALPLHVCVHAQRTPVLFSSVTCAGCHGCLHVMQEGRVRHRERCSHFSTYGSLALHFVSSVGALLPTAPGACECLRVRAEQAVPWARHH
jgi:hypothetical protein